MRSNILLASKLLKKPNAYYLFSLPSTPSHTTLQNSKSQTRLLVTVMLNRLPKLWGFYFLVKKTIHIFESELIYNIMMYKRKIKLKLVTFHPPKTKLDLSTFLLSLYSFSPHTNYVITNIMYLYASWCSKFHKNFFKKANDKDKVIKQTYHQAHCNHILDTSL